MAEILEGIKYRIAESLTTYTRTLLNCHYADIRIEINDTRWASAEDGKPKSAGKDEGGSFGIRVIAGITKKAPGYYGRIFGLKDIDKIEELIKEGLNHAHARALANSKNKERLSSALEGFGKTLWDTQLASVEIHRDTVPAIYKIAPGTIAPQEILRLSEEASKRIKGLSGIQFNDITVYTQSIGELFVSTEGALIDQYFAYTQGNVYVVASGKEGQQELYEYVGDQEGGRRSARGSMSRG